MRLFIDTGSVAEVEEIARWGVLAGELGWDEARTAEEAQTFRANADAEGILPG